MKKYTKFVEEEFNEKIYTIKSNDFETKLKIPNSDIVVEIDELSKKELKKMIIFLDELYLMGIEYGIKKTLSELKIPSFEDFKTNY